MAAAAFEELIAPAEKDPGTGRGGGGPVDEGPGWGGDGGGGEGDEHWLAGTYLVGMRAVVVAVVTLFAALALVYILRSRNPKYWEPVRIPPVLAAATLVLLSSSATMEAARRLLRAGDARRFRTLLALTLSLACAFLAMQVEACRELVAEGMFVAANPHSFFLYMFTGSHALHLAGGIAMLWYMLLRAVLPSLRETNAARVRERADAAALYWHAIDAVWLGLFALLCFVG
jgi:cytochrome c oxidase subunit 3